MSSIARRIARNAAKRKLTSASKGWNGITSSFRSRDDLRAQMAAERYQPQIQNRDRSAEAAEKLTQAMNRAQTKWGEPGVSTGYQPDGSYVSPEGVHMSKAYMDNLQTDKPELEGKGEKGKLCNRTACQAPGAYWYNHSTQAFYCGTCADLINQDKFNRADAERLYGHPLLTLDPDFADKLDERL